VQVYVGATVVPCCPAPMSYSMLITCALLEQINDDDDDDDEIQGHCSDFISLHRGSLTLAVRSPLNAAAAYTRHSRLSFAFSKVDFDPVISQSYSCMWLAPFSIENVIDNGALFHRPHTNWWSVKNTRRFLYT